MLRDWVTKNRSYRRFYEDTPIDRATLRELVNLARLSASGSNLQPLCYILSWEPERNAQIFQCLAWAGYLVDWTGPVEGERPSAYIVILGDQQVRDQFDTDCGIAAQSIMLGATEKGLGGCMIGSIQRAALRGVLDIPERYKILLVLALGKPKEKVVIDEVGQDGDIRYWRDDEDVHHVPKRRLDDIIVG
ncbi:MAG: nitroreductase family protein [Anaerolineae bacterium]|nr:nitroreductase family protein [Anaerolineae bacterium]